MGQLRRTAIGDDDKDAGRVDLSCSCTHGLSISDANLMMVQDQEADFDLRLSSGLIRYRQRWELRSLLEGRNGTTMAGMLSLEPLDRQLPPWQELQRTILSSSIPLIDSLRKHDSAASASSPWSEASKVYNISSCPTTARSTSKKVRRPALPGSGETNGHRWHSRTSFHPSSTTAGRTTTTSELYDQFRRGLLLNHSLNEKDYIESCCDAELLEVIERGVLEIWRMSYHLPFPTANREFIILILTVDTTPTSASPDEPRPNRSFQVVSIPIEHEKAPRRRGFARGKYVSVEEVSEDGDKVVWRMATASSAGGMVPRAISEMAMPSKISEDVPSFIEWLATRSSISGQAIHS